MGRLNLYGGRPRVVNGRLRAGCCCGAPTCNCFPTGTPATYPPTQYDGYMFDLSLSLLAGSYTVGSTTNVITSDVTIDVTDAPFTCYVGLQPSFIGCARLDSSPGYHNTPGLPFESAFALCRPLASTLSWQDIWIVKFGLYVDSALASASATSINGNDEMLSWLIDRCATFGSYPGNIDLTSGGSWDYSDLDQYQYFPAGTGLSCPASPIGAANWLAAISDFTLSIHT